ncbi:prephenate dehydrogenase/arogenate dehydrogenase family protein [Streptomyces sp. NPDC048436]|uniref:prephenate dehydrogenase/arogenate dehydrogenase family protein n=1 Tax=Streptomyces sp. NPDC048436 TaxID=3365550 RepID=UPI003712951A
MRSALIVGTGCVGTSAALALRAAGVAVHLAEADQDSLRLAASLGAGTPEPPAEQVDLALLAVPADEVAPTLSQLQKQGAAQAYTDVAGVKLRPQQEALRRSCDMSSYVGGHPLVDRVRAGPLAARLDLFRNRRWALTPTEATDSRALNQALELVALSGATPVVVDAAEHDEIAARTTQLPYLVVALLAGQPAPPHPLTEDTNGADQTQTAPVEPWSALLAGNAEAVLRHLRRLDGDIHRAMEALEQVVTATADSQGKAAAHGRLRAMLGRTAPHHTRSARYATDTVRVSVHDRPGELARLLADVTAKGMNIVDFAMDRTSGQLLGTAEISVARDRAAQLASDLSARGWLVDLAGPAPSRPTS